MLTRRARLCNIIRALCHTGSPRFTVTIGNGFHLDPFNRADVLDMLTDEGLEIIARRLVIERQISNRTAARNRAIYARNRAALSHAAE